MADNSTKLRVIQTDTKVTTNPSRWISIGNDAIIFDKSAGGIYIGNGSQNPTLIATKVTNTMMENVVEDVIGGLNLVTADWVDENYMPLAGGDVSSTNFRLIHRGSNYTEGIRLAHKDSSVGKWSGIHFGCDPSVSSGTHSKQWTVARNANNNFVIRNNESDIVTIDTSKNTTFSGKLNVSNALVGITKNSNTFTLGSQDSNFCHLHNSANIPFKFNNTIVPSASGSYNLGSDTLKWKNIYASGDIYSVAYYTSSDERLKTFGNNVEVDLNKLSKLRKSYFTFNSDDTSKTHIGVSAQEIMEIYPEIVNTDENGYLSVDYAKLSVIALKAVDNLHERLTRLEKLLLDKE